MSNKAIASLPGFCILALALALTSAREAQAEDSVEFKIKAGCLFKFLQFVEWPPAAFKDKNSPVIVGVLGDDPFDTVLDKTVEGRDIDGRSIVVRRYKDPKAAREAHVVYVGLKGEKLAAALKTLDGSPALTVGETSAFIDSGGAIRFVIRNEKVSFDINPEASKAAGLKIGAQLLRLANIVRPKGD